MYTSISFQLLLLGRMGNLRYSWTKCGNNLCIRFWPKFSTKTLQNFYWKFFWAMCCNPFLKMFVYECKMKTYELETCPIMFISCPHIRLSYFICKYIFQKHSKLSRPALNKSSVFLSFYFTLSNLFLFGLEQHNHEYRSLKWRF